MGVGRKVNPTNCRRLECLVGFVIKADIVGTPFANQDVIVLSLLNGLSDILLHERLTWKCWNCHVLEVWHPALYEVYQKWHELLVQMDWKGFGEEVGEVVNAFAPSDRELFLMNSITDPVKSHVNTLCAFWFYSV